MLKFKSVILKDCPYSEKADTLLHCLQEAGVIENYEPTYISYEQKQSYKQKNKMETFPHIFYSRNLRFKKIGGLDDLVSFLTKHFT
jgi:glutaredoxin